MKMEQLRYVVEVAKTKSIKKAAENLYLSQPNLSTSIRNLEDELGCSLIVRTNRGVQLTKQGEDFVEYASSIIDQFDHLQSLGISDRDNSFECLSVANANFRFVNLLAASFFNSHQDPPIRMIIHELSRDGVIQAVESGRSEIGFINMLEYYSRNVIKQIESRSLRFTKLSTDRITVLIGPKNPLFSYDGEIDINMLSHFPMLYYDEMDAYHYSDRAKLLGIKTDRGEIVVDSRKALHEILINTDAFAIVTWNEDHYRVFPYDEDLKQFNIKDCKYNVDFGWICSKDAVLTPLAREFIDLVCTSI